MNCLCCERQASKSMIYSQLANGNAPYSFSVLRLHTILPHRFTVTHPCKLNLSSNIPHSSVVFVWFWREREKKKKKWKGVNRHMDKYSCDSVFLQWHKPSETQHSHKPQMHTGYQQKKVLCYQNFPHWKLWMLQQFWVEKWEAITFNYNYL